MQFVETIIVGGGPAGASCAARLMAGGRECLVLDKAEFPRAKTCAGWITPDVFTLLGITPENYPLGLTHFKRFDIWFNRVRIQPRVNQYAIRRVEFDAWMIQRSGVPVEKHTVKEIRQERKRFIIDEEYSCKYLVGAGGTTCPVYKILFDSDYPRKESSLIVAMEDEFHYPGADPRCRLWFFREGLPGYAWYVPKAEGFVNVGIGGRMRGLKDRGVTIRDYWERLKVWLDEDGLVRDYDYQPQGWHYYLRGKQPCTKIGNAFLAGDAAGLATVDMGEGIRAALMSGMRVADAIIHSKDYAIRGVPKLSFPSLFLK